MELVYYYLTLSYKIKKLSFRVGYQKLQDFIQFLKPSPCTLKRKVICSCGLGQMAWGPKISFTLKTSNGLPNRSVLFLYSKSYILSKNATNRLDGFLLPLAPQNQLNFEMELDFICLFWSPSSKCRAPFHRQQLSVPSTLTESEGVSETSCPQLLIHSQNQDNLHIILNLNYVLLPFQYAPARMTLPYPQ